MTTVDILSTTNGEIRSPKGNHKVTHQVKQNNTDKPTSNIFQLPKRLIYDGCKQVLPHSQLNKK